jgi:hypothetical protein
MMNACTRWSLLAVPVLTALGCSDPVPLPSQGSVSLNIMSVAVSGMSCPTTAKVYQIGSPAPTTTDPGQSVVDGDKGSSVSCSVQGSGPYTFSGSLTGITSEGQPISLTLNNGTVDANKSTGTVNVNVSTPDLGAVFSSGSTPCTVTVNNMQVKPGNPGSIWLNFTCPTIANPPSNLCGIGQSTIVFQNCNG